MVVAGVSSHSNSHASWIAIDMPFCDMPSSKKNGGAIITIPPEEKKAVSAGLVSRVFDAIGTVTSSVREFSQQVTGAFSLGWSDAQDAANPVTHLNEVIAALLSNNTQSADEVSTLQKIFDEIAEQTPPEKMLVFIGGVFQSLIPAIEEAARQQVSAQPASASTEVSDGIADFLEKNFVQSPKGFRDKARSVVFRIDASKRGLNEKAHAALKKDFSQLPRKAILEAVQENLSLLEKPTKMQMAYGCIGAMLADIVFTFLGRVLGNGINEAVKRSGVYVQTFVAALHAVMLAGFSGRAGYILGGEHKKLAAIAALAATFGLYGASAGILYSAGAGLSGMFSHFVGTLARHHFYALVKQTLFSVTQTPNIGTSLPLEAWRAGIPSVLAYAGAQMSAEIPALQGFFQAPNSIFEDPSAFFRSIFAWSALEGIGSSFALSLIRCVSTKSLGYKENFVVNPLDPKPWVAGVASRFFTFLLTTNAKLLLDNSTEISPLEKNLIFCAIIGLMELRGLSVQYLLDKCLGIRVSWTGTSTGTDTVSESFVRSYSPKEKEKLRMFLSVNEIINCIERGESFIKYFAEQGNLLQQKKASQEGGIVALTGYENRAFDQREEKFFDAQEGFGQLNAAPPATQQISREETADGKPGPFGGIGRGPLGLVRTDWMERGFPFSNSFDPNHSDDASEKSLIA